MKGLFIISLLCTTVHTGHANPLSDIVLISLLALLLFIATVTALWEILKTESPVEAKALDFFLIFAVVVVPFTMFIYFGLAIEVYEATAATQPSWPPWSSMSWQIEVGSAVIYFVVTTWLPQPRTYCHIADSKLDLGRILPAKVVRPLSTGAS